jgi:hypothetical protein
MGVYIVGVARRVLEMTDIKCKSCNVDTATVFTVVVKEGAFADVPIGKTWAWCTKCYPSRPHPRIRREITRDEYIHALINEEINCHA